MAESIELLTFNIDEHLFGIPASQGREVLRAVAITVLPGAPPIVEGVIDMRGAIVPVLDVRSRFGLPASELQPSEHFIVAWTGKRVIALRVSQVAGLQAVDQNSVVKASAITTAKYRLNGVVRTSEGLILFHDLGGFLDQAEAEQLEQALERAAAP